MDQSPNPNPPEQEKERNCCDNLKTECNDCCCELFCEYLADFFCILLCFPCKIVQKLFEED